VSDARAVRVLIADDSESVRALLRTVLTQAGCEVVGEAADGIEAIEMSSLLAPDVVTMDVVMPKLDGLGATAAIMTHSPTRIVVVCDSRREEQTDLSFRAMSAGALELLSKQPEGTSLPEWGRHLAETVKLMADVPVVRRRRFSVAQAGAYGDSDRTVSALGIVASTGGPPALGQLLSALPASYPFPLLVAQHMTPGFTPGLIRWLSGTVRLRVLQASDGMPLEPGTVVLPPDGRDLSVDRKRIRTPQARDPGCSPSGDVLLSSLAATFGGSAGGIVLTGMGEDGARGLLEIRRAGGFTMAQDQATSIVWGMPGAAARLGATDALFPIDHMAIKLMQLAAHAQKR
jgi:two-component system chemotaxis response regulator CheB